MVVSVGKHFLLLNLFSIVSLLWQLGLFRLKGVVTLIRFLNMQLCHKNKTKENEQTIPPLRPIFMNAMSSFPDRQADRQIDRQ